jgi:hypothetical protein
MRCGETGPASGIYFPIRDEPEMYDAVAPDALRGVPPWAREAIRALQPFSTDPGRWAGREIPHLHELARIDRHRVPPIHAAVVVPDSASGDDLSGTLPRIGPGGQWAEWEYIPGGTARVDFRVEVLFGPDSGQPDGVEVAGWTGYLVQRAAEAIDMVLRSSVAPGGD